MVSVTMPQLGATVVEGTVTRWLKREGEPVEEHEPLVEVITDKVNSELPSPAAGVVARIVVPEGQTARVGAEIAVIEVAERVGVVEVVEGGPPVPAPHAPPSAEELQQGGAAPAPRSSPLVRRLAREHGVDVGAIRGSGAGGRVRKEDMLAYVEAKGKGPEVAPAATTAPGAARSLPPTADDALVAVPPVTVGATSDLPAPGADAGGDEERLPLTPMRRAIAEHMARSVNSAPHAWTYVEVDVDGLVKWRERVRAEYRQREGFDLTYLPFVAKAVVETLRQHPILNSTWRDGQVVLKRRIHLGIATALEDGLVVPVIRDADSKSIAGLARALDDVVTRARAGKLGPDDVREGTFTLNNTGALGSILSMPIINQPQAAILTMEAITRRVVVLPGDAIAVRPMLNLCLSFDHRVCDGLQVGRFMQGLKGRLEGMSPADSLY